MALPHEWTLAANTPLYRITSSNFLTSSRFHRKVVNGQGAVQAQFGGRYNHAGVATVYLTENITSCLAERAFYFQREYLQVLDGFNATYPNRPSLLPLAPLKSVVLWQVTFRAAVAPIADLDVTTAGSFNIFPTLMSNPSQDYEHLRARRAALQHQRYVGLRAPSSRCTNGGRMLVLFSDMSRSVESIEPVHIELRLVDGGNRPFANHAVDLLNFESIEARALPAAASPLPAWASGYASWTRVAFRH